MQQCAPNASPMVWFNYSTVGKRTSCAYFSSIGTIEAFLSAGKNFVIVTKLSAHSFLTDQIESSDNFKKSGSFE